MYVVIISLRKRFVLHRIYCIKSILENYKKNAKTNELQAQACVMDKQAIQWYTIIIPTMFPSLLILSLFSFLHFRKKPDNSYVKRITNQKCLSICSPLFVHACFAPKYLIGAGDVLSASTPSNSKLKMTTKNLLCSLFVIDVIV